MGTTGFDLELFIGLSSHRSLSAKKSLADVHRGNGSGVQDTTKEPRITKTPGCERSILRIVEREAQAPYGLISAVLAWL